MYICALLFQIESMHTCFSLSSVANLKTMAMQTLSSDHISYIDMGINQHIVILNYPLNSTAFNYNTYDKYQQCHSQAIITPLTLKTWNMIWSSVNNSTLESVAHCHIFQCLFLVHFITHDEYALRYSFDYHLLPKTVLFVICALSENLVK